MSYAEEVVMAAQRVESGQGNDDDVSTLREALLRMAPSSPTYRRVAKALSSQRGYAAGTTSTYGSLLNIGREPDLGSYPKQDEMFQGPTQDEMFQGPTQDETSYGPPSPAEEADAAGDPSGGEPPTPDSYGFDDGLGAGVGALGLVAPASRSAWASQDPMESYNGAGNFLPVIPQGYSFSDMNAAGIDTLMQNPDLFAQQLSGASSGNSALTQFMTPRVEAAMEMARQGLLSDTGARGDLGAGPMASENRLALAEQFALDSMEPGRMVDVRSLYDEAFGRSMATDWESRSGEGGAPMTPEDIIGATNGALLQVAAFLPQDSQQALASRLSAASRDYILMVGHGKATMSYPKYLQSIGAYDWL